MEIHNPWQYEDAHRAEICEWLRANDIDPGCMPIYTSALIVDGEILYQSGRRDMDDVVRGRDPDRALRVERAPLKVEPSGVVRRWLRVA